MTIDDHIKAAQTRLRELGFLEVRVDGDPGPITRAAVAKARDIESDTQTVKASSFADEADLASFRRCKQIGNSDMFCFARGDNGIGFAAMPVEDNDTWVPIEGDTDGRINCGQDEIPCCALPPEIWLAKWGSVKNAAGARVAVTYKGQTVEGILGDTMPHIKNIHNGARIDLNPAFLKAFGLTPPVLVDVSWSWITK